MEHTVGTEGRCEERESGDQDGRGKGKGKGWRLTWNRRGKIGGPGGNTSSKLISFKSLNTLDEGAPEGRVVSCILGNSSEIATRTGSNGSLRSVSRSSQHLTHARPLPDRMMVVDIEQSWEERMRWFRLALSANWTPTLAWGYTN